MDQIIAVGQRGEFILHHAFGGEIGRIVQTQIFDIGFKFLGAAGEHKTFDDVRIVHIERVCGADRGCPDAAEQPLRKNIAVIDHCGQGDDCAQDKGEPAHDKTDLGKKGKVVVLFEHGVTPLGFGRYILPENRMG